MHIQPRELLIEIYISPTQKCFESSIYKYEFWKNKNGELHSINGQPADINYENGIIIRKRWYKNGIRHRSSGLPSIIYYKENGQIVRKHWHKNGKIIKSKVY